MGVTPEGVTGTYFFYEQKADICDTNVCRETHSFRENPLLYFSSFFVHYKRKYLYVRIIHMNLILYFCYHFQINVTNIFDLQYVAIIAINTHTHIHTIK